MVTQSADELSSLYLEHSPTWHVEESAWKAGYIVEMLKKNGISPYSIVDVGCGAGEVLLQVYNKLDGKPVCEGYDVAIDAYKKSQARQKEKLSYFHGNAFENDKKYDLLLMIDVFEHVEECFSFLRRASEKAKYKIYHIPLDLSVYSLIINNFKYVRVPGGHIHYYTKFTALKTLEETGHEIVDYFYTPGALEVHNKGLTMFGRFTNFLRKVGYKINKDATVKYLGGFSLMVLTK
jgi:SAM-dependent methyltransferase